MARPVPQQEHGGTPGVDILKLAHRSISGFFPSFKTGDTNVVRQPFTSILEERLGMYLEYHPLVRFFQRGDASAAFAQARRIATPLGTPYPITYTYEDKAHDYLPDYIGQLKNGGLLVAEAGLAEKKRQGKNVVKAQVALRHAELHGGTFWLATEEQLSLRRHYNLIFLHARRWTFSSFAEIAPTLVAAWPWGEPRTAAEIIEQFRGQWSPQEVEAAFWKIVGDAAAQGQLIADLTAIDLDLTTPLELLDPSLPPLLPEPLPSSLVEEDEGQSCDDDEEDEVEANDRELNNPLIPGATFDDSILTSEQRVHFTRNIDAVTKALAGESLRAVARHYDMSVATLSRLKDRVQAMGQIACVPYRTYDREPALHPKFQQKIRDLYMKPIRPTIRAIYESDEMKTLAKKLSHDGKGPLQMPSYRQVWSCIQRLRHEPDVVDARAALKHPSHPRMSPYSFVLSIPSPGLVCQVDEHDVDYPVVLPDGTLISRKAYAAVLICVKTGAPMGAILSLTPLVEEDYMRLIKQAIEPKQRFLAPYECKHDWPCHGKPAIILCDRGKIFTSERARQVLVDRLHIVMEIAPPYCPSAKGTVEAIFKWMVDKFEHRLPGTTKSSLRDRGNYDTYGEATQAGITFDLLETFFYQALVDDYLQDWDKLRRQSRAVLWEDAVRRTGIPRWLGSQDDLKLLLMRAINRRNTTTGRYAPHGSTISFKDRSYVSPGLLNRLHGQEIDLYYDWRDITVIYLFLKGVHVGEAYCVEFQGRRVSEWEADAMRRSDKEQSSAAQAESLANRQRMLQEASSGKKALSKRAKQVATQKAERQRQLDEQRIDIHPAYVQAMLKELASAATVPVIPPQVTPLVLPQPDTDDTPVRLLPVRRSNLRE